MTTINKIIRAGVLGGLLMGAVTLNASNPITNTDKTPNQTEVVSKEGAAALRAISLQGVQQATVPSVHNTQIDNLFIKFASTPEEKKEISAVINSMYTDGGTFLASALLQHELDRQQLLLLLEEKGDMLTKNELNPELGESIKKFGSDFYKSVRPNSKTINNWLNNKYTPDMMEYLGFDHKPNAEEVIKRLDYIAEHQVNFSSDNFLQYVLNSDSYINRNNLKGKTDAISLSKIIAHKMFSIDFIIFKKSLTNCNVFGPNSKFNQFSELKDYYEKWMKTVSTEK